MAYQITQWNLPLICIRVFTRSRGWTTQVAIILQGKITCKNRNEKKETKSPSASLSIIRYETLFQTNAIIIWH